MHRQELQAIAQAAAKNIKTEEDPNEFRQMLTKITVEAALDAELNDHLGFEKHGQPDSDNSRNGATYRRLQAEDGQFELPTPRDRTGNFEFKLVKKHQRFQVVSKTNPFYSGCAGVITFKPCIICPGL